MMMRNVALLMFLVAWLAAALAAQDSGDAPSSYGEMYSYLGAAGGVSLGTQISDDAVNPVGGDWVSDNDDGVVGAPTWDPWSASNTLTVHVVGTGWLIMWVDANDNGVWEPAERYRYSQMFVKGPGNFTFTGIRLTAQQDYSLNGANKVAVRITLQEGGGNPNPKLQPNGWFYNGEVEDWLIDVAPVSFAVATLNLANAVEGDAVQSTITAVHGVAPYTWSLVAGTVPSGLTLAQVGNDFLLSGTLAQGSGTGAPVYLFTVGVSDSASHAAQRQLSLRVLPSPVAAPFEDTFSSDRGWQREGTWVRAAATGYAGQAFNAWSEYVTEPTTDFSTGTDNMILADSLGTHFVYQGFMPQTIWATSPMVDCTGLSSVQLRFRRWLSTLRAPGAGTSLDRVCIQAGHDGGNWVDIWKPSMLSAASKLVDVDWTLMVYDISAVAANQVRVQVRFGIGPAIDGSSGGGTTGVQYCPDDFAGWCIDDVEIIETPAATVQASGFDIQTTGSMVHPGDGLTYPLVYPGSVHNWTAQVTNSGAVALTISEFEVGVSIPVQPGSGPDDIKNHRMHLSWYQAGAWSTTLPLVVPAGATVQMQGQFVCSVVTRPSNLFAFKLFLRGDVPGGGTFEATDAEQAVISNKAQPGLHVWEGPPATTGQTEFFNGDIATGLRDFGSVVTGSVSGWTLIICKSDTSNTFTVDPPTLSGPDAGQFQLGLPNPWNYTPTQGANDCYFYVRFTPTSVGPKIATVSFTHTAPNTATPFTFEVVGFGVAAAPVVRVFDTSTGGVIPNGSAAVGGLDFGQLDITTPAYALTIEIENQGTMTLTLGTPQLATGSAWTIDTTNFNGTLTPNGTTSFELMFAPQAIGVYADSVSFTHNDTGTANPFTFALAGQGIVNAPLLRVTLDSSMGPTITSGAPASGLTQFATLDVAATPTSALSVYVHNDGWQNLQLTGVPSLSGHVADFGIDTASVTLTIAPGQFTSFSVWFDPVAKGPKAATVQFAHNAGATDFTFDLAGTGYDPNGVSIPSTFLPGAEVGAAYTTLTQATGGTAPYTWALVGGTLPAGLSLAADGTISGTPTGPHAVYQFRLLVTDAMGGTEERQMTLIVSPAPGTLDKGDNSSSGGCAASTSSGAALLLLLLLAAFATNRRAREC